MPTTRNDSSTTEEERHSKPPQILKESAMERITSPAAAMGERPSVTICENAGKTPEKGTQESSSNTDENGRKAVTETRDKLHMEEDTVDLVQNDGTEKPSDHDKNNNAKTSIGAVDVEHSDVSDCVNEYFDGNVADSCVLVSGLKNVPIEHEMKFDEDSDYSYNWVDDMWTAYGARPRTRDESEYEVEMERVQAEYDMEFELNQCNPYSLISGSPKDDTQNENASELKHSDEVGNGEEGVQSEGTGQDDFEAHSQDVSYSEGNSVKHGESEETGTDETSSGVDDTQSEVTAEEDFEVHSDDSYSEGSSSFDDDQSGEESGTDEASSGMDDDEVTDYERDEYERIIRWIETVNKAMFPHLVNNLENHAAVKKGQALGFTEFLITSASTGLDDVQSAMSEDEIDQEAQSDALYRNGSQRAESENKSDYEEACSKETRSDVQSAVAANQQVHSDRHLIMNGSQSAESDYEEESEETSETTDVQSAVIHSWLNRPKTRDEREYERAVCSLTDPVMYGQKQTQETGVAYGVVTANDELLPKLKMDEMENNVPGARGGLGRGFARFSAAARRFFQRCVPRCCRGNSG